jgi:putative transposase
MKEIRRSHKFKLRPTQEQQQLFVQFAGNSRFVYNELLSWSSQLYKRFGLSVVSRAKFGKRITQLKAQHDWLCLSHVHTLQSSADDLVSGYNRFFKNGGGYPKFKSKHNTKQSFRYKTGVELDGSRVKLPKIGWVKVRNSRGDVGQIKTATISQSTSGWYVSLSCIEEIEQHPKTESSVGIDLGLSHYATLSTGEKIDNPRYYRRAERKLRRLQRALSRKKKGSANRAKARAKLAKHHEKVANMRKDFQHKLTTRLVVENQAIGVESLFVAGMVRNRKLAKSISDAGWGETLRQLKYKSDWHGRTLVEADRFYPSSKLTNCCGVRLTDLRLSDREIVCPECGQIWDRDHNAAINLRPVAVGHTDTLNDCGGES